MWSNSEGICNLWMMAKVTGKACHIRAEIAHAHVLNALKHLLGNFLCGQTSSIIKLLSFSWQRRLKTKNRRGRRWKEFQTPQERHSSWCGLCYILPGCCSAFLCFLWPDIFFCLVHQCPAKYVVPPRQCGMHCTVFIFQLWSFPRFIIFIICCSLLTVLKELLIIGFNFSYLALRSELK